MSPRNTLAQRSRADVYTALKDAIQYLDLRPGAVIHENSLAEKLGCSRTPIREALIRLSGEYLIDIFPQRGTYVSQIDFRLAHEVAYMRHILDSSVCMALCEQQASISEAVDERLYFMSNAVKKRNIVEYIRADNAFHQAIFAYAGHEMVWSIISNSRAHYNRMLVLDLQRPGILEKSYQEHLNMVKCIESGDKSQLEALMDVHHDHKDNTARETAIRACFPEYFLAE